MIVVPILLVFFGMLLFMTHESVTDGALIKRGLAMLGVCCLVWTQDSNYSVRLGIARQTPFGWICKTLGSDWVMLNPDGTVCGTGYVKRWAEWEYNRKHVVFEEAKPRSAVE